MTISKKIWAISAVAILSASAYGCSDDSGSAIDNLLPEIPECTATTCDGNVLKNCVSGKIEEDNCASHNQICSNKKCIDPAEAPDCTEDACSADVKTLLKCVGGKVQEESCELQGKICENKQCVAKPECSEDVCDGDVLKKCVGGKIQEDNCASHNQTCSSAEKKCVDKQAEEACSVEGYGYCDEDANGNKNGIWKKCVGGKYQIEDCDANGQRCVDADDAEQKGCIDPPPCSENENGCNDNTLIICNTETGKLVKTNCDEDDHKICDNNAKSCRYECEDTEEATCANNGAKKVCSNHKYEVIPCEGNNAYCSGGECYTRSKEEQCVAEGKVYDEATDSCVLHEDTVVGTPCECTGNCDITITGKELKALFSEDVKKVNIDAVLLKINAAEYINIIKDDDVIVAPNFFPGKENIDGCTGLVVPEGMTLGCFRDSMIVFPDSINQLLNKINQLVSSFSPDVAAKIKKIADLLKANISFTSPNGYCLAATIDIGGNMDAYVNLPDKTIDLGPLGQMKMITGMDGNPLTSNPLDKETGLVKKINTGDHATVVQGAEAAELSGENYCPDGSTLFSYTLIKQLAKNIDQDLPIINHPVKANLALDVNVGFDMCLKSCERNEDCRVDEGYSCVELPNGVPADGQTVDELPKKKACFDNANIEYFTNMTGLLGGEE